MSTRSRYDELVERMSNVIIGASAPDQKLEAVMAVCDISARVLREVFPNEEERLAALDSFLRRLGSVMDQKGGGREEDHRLRH